MIHRRSRAALLLLSGLAATGCQPEAGREAPDFRATVQSAVVGTGPVERVLVTTGSVRAREEARLVVETAGKLALGRDPATSRRLAVGDPVRRGQVIAVVAAEEVRTTARIGARQQALDAAVAERDRNARLLAEGVVSELRVEELETRVVSARADLDQAFVQERRGRFVAPIAGVISRVTVAPDGEYLAPGHEVATIMDFEEVVVDLDLSSSEALEVAVGMPARVRTYATGDVHVGRVARLAPAVDPTSRTLRAEVVVPNGDLRLRPGMFVRAEVVLEGRGQVVLVPSEAIENFEGGQAVFVVAPGPVARRRAIQIGLAQADVTEVRSGLTAGERIVVAGHRTLSDGARVVEIGNSN